MWAAGPPYGGHGEGGHDDARLGLALFAAAWTRYEAWLIVAIALDLAWYALIRKGLGLRRATALIMRLTAWPASAILLFSINSRLTTGSWLVTGGFYEIDPTYHGLAFKSLIAVWWGTHRLTGYLVEAAGLLTAAWLLWQALARREWSARLLPVAVLAAAVLPFYGFLEGHPFRVRYMVVPAAGCALLCGIAVGFLRNRAAAASLIVLVTTSLIESPPWNTQAPMVEEATWDVPRTIERRAVTACFIRQYHDDKILASMGSLAHYMQELSAEGLRIADFIHEGNGELWTLALRSGPAPHAGWMIVEEQAEGGDLLARKIREDTMFARGMARVCAGGGVAVYRRD